MNAATNGGVMFARTGADDFPAHMKVMVVGPPKAGKTSLLGTIPNLLVLDTEPHANNLQSIAHLDVPYVTITNTDDLRQVAFILGNDTLRKQLAQQTYGLPDIEAVAIDTLDTLQAIVKAERMAENGTTRWERDDWGWLKLEMENIVARFTKLPLHVIFTVHTKTQEIGKGDDAWTKVLPGLQGSIAESIAGMVGYSLLAERTEEVAPDGTKYMKYWLRTEGDASHDFLGTRVSGTAKLPLRIEPNMGSIYAAVMAGRPAKQAAVQQPDLQPPAAPAEPAGPPPGEVAQTPGQSQGVQTPVETPASQAPPAERPADSEPINAAALGHLKRVYDALSLTLPEETLRTKTLGDARTVVKMWVAIQQDYAEGKGQEGTTAQQEMLNYLQGQNLLPDAAPAQQAKPEVVGKPDGTVAEIKVYVGNPPDLARVQEVYDLEYAKGDQGRVTVLKKMEELGAQTTLPSSIPTGVPTSPPAPAAEPITPSSEAPQPVTPAASPADALDAEAEGLVREGLGGVKVEEGINPSAQCATCGGPLDDLDLAELGKRRFGELLCVKDYVKRTDGA